MSLFEIQIQDGTGRLRAVWFNQPFLRESLVRGCRVVLFGKVERDARHRGGRMMASPQHEVLEDEEPGGQVHSGRIVPVYERLGPLTGNTLRRVLTELVRGLPEDLPDVLGPEIRRRLGVGGRLPALREVHDPADADIDELNRGRSGGHKRLILEELFLFQLGLAYRHGLERRRRGIAFRVSERTRRAAREVLPFRLTTAQRRVVREIVDDMRAPRPMNRLLQGDVGSGKTVVALMAMVVAVEDGYQAALMAPTEVLAEQHHLTLRELLKSRPYRLELVSGSLAGRARQAAQARVADGTAQVVVGTHALIQESVTFQRLGLAIVDEQHRFGVLQRDRLRQKGGPVDVLVMTATPIPRTLAMTAYGDLDTSVLEERPPGRCPVRTLHRPAGARREVVELVRRELRGGGQAFVVYPLVAESEKLEDVRAVTQMAEEWTRELAEARVGMLHGRLPGAAKEQVMLAFGRGELDVLVSTTVIEVGVDVKNASAMVIEHAERFGLAQLHQLRGRVGRGPRPATCVLLSHGRLSPEARERLAVMVETDDGFRIAERDLEIRGPGDFFGTRQWGLPSLRIARLQRDRDLLEHARQAAFGYARDRPAAEVEELLRGSLPGGGWERRFGLALVG